MAYYFGICIVGGIALEPPADRVSRAWSVSSYHDLVFFFPLQLTPHGEQKPYLEHNSVYRVSFHRKTLPKVPTIIAIDAL